MSSNKGFNSKREKDLQFKKKEKQFKPKRHSKLLPPVERKLDLFKVKTILEKDDE
jgi:hypothetical protein